MKNIVLASQIIIFFTMILFIGAYFSLDKYVSLDILIKTLLTKSPIALVGALIAVFVQHWALKKMNKK
ncbi:MAG: hypothetical protein IPL46_10250 [Saprospiraceae bacterium]|nr:hypothetical protein [Saprospiraceae bacterium]